MKPWGPYAAAAVLALALGLSLAAHYHAPPSAAPTQAAPLFAASFPDLGGRQVALADFKGQILVVNFWATWCAPCVEEMPDLQRIHLDYAGRGVRVIGIGIDNPAAMRKFRDDLKIDFPLLAAGAGGSELARALGNPSGSLPFTVLVDAQGGVGLRRLGRIRPDEVRAWIDAQPGKSRT